MSETSCRRWCVAVCLVGGLILIPGRALASPPGSSWFRVAKPSSVASHVRSLLYSLWQEAGCVIDPNGSCVSPPSETIPTSDAGCWIDPNGHCITNR